MKHTKIKKNYLFKVLWSKSYVAIAIDEVNQQKASIPITSFYFWPREDGWKLLKADLDSKPWMEERAKLEILNGYTEIVNFWLNNLSKHTSLNNLNKHSLNLNLDIIATNAFW